MVWSVFLLYRSELGVLGGFVLISELCTDFTFNFRFQLQ